MKPWRTLSFFATVLITAFILVLVVASFQLKPDARVWPQVVGFPLLALLGLALVSEFSPRLEAMFEVSWEGAALEEGMEEGESRTTRKMLLSDVPWRIVLTVFGSLLLAAIGVLWLGFLVAVPLYILLFLRLFGGASWRGSAILAIATTLSLFALSRLVRVDLYPGMVTGAPIPPF